MQYSGQKPRVVITGFSGTLGGALAQIYQEKSWDVIGVTRREFAASEGEGMSLVKNAQTSRADAEALLALDADLIVLCAGAIETEIGPEGLPLLKSLEDLNKINYEFPASLALLAAEKKLSRPLTLCAIGSIADGSPSCFGPLYHASKAALHFFVSSVAPIIAKSNPQLTLRLYRPGVIYGPLSWAPVNRLNQKAYAIRARRCQGAPKARQVALRIVRWLEGTQTVGSDREPLSFLLLKLAFALAPSLYAKLQNLAWLRASRWGRAVPMPKATLSEGTLQPGKEAQG